jgi:hypothetical protein
MVVEEITCPKCGEVDKINRDLVPGSSRERYFKEKNQLLRVICQKVLNSPTYIPSVEECICFKDWNKLDQYLDKRISDLGIKPPAPLCEFHISQKIELIIADLTQKVTRAENDLEKELGR